MASIFGSLKEKSDWLIRAVGVLLSRPPETCSSSCSGFSQMAEDLEQLRRMVERIRALLGDAEEREIRESRVKLWLDELRDVGYDAEDLIEGVEYESLRHRGGLGRGASPAVTWGIWVGDKDQVVAEIKAINDRFDEIWKHRVGLELREEDGQGSWARRLAGQWRDRESGCLVDERRVHGRRHDRRRVIDMLLSDDDPGVGGGDDEGNTGVRVVSIVGMGGVGKTTLAQLVFNDGRVAGRFQTRLWVCVTDAFDVTKLTRSILQQLLGPSFKLRALGPLQERLREELDKKVFLLVLDDVWNESQEIWDALWVSLLGGAKGSRVLITSRSDRVSMVSRASHMYRLGFLSQGYSWSLFAQQAFGGRSIDDHPDLVPLGLEIVRRCQGLPLTVKMLAGLLFGELRVERWADILESDMWELQEGEDSILPALKLSYYHLRPDVKPCFAYCAVFPKDYKFHEDELVYLWMAQGYIRPPEGKPMEVVGRQCFQDLVQRSFFQHSGDGHFQMHGLIHDLALSIRGGECSKLLREGGRLPNTLIKPRHLWFEHRGAVAHKTALIVLSPCGSTDRFPPCLRTFYLLKESWTTCSAHCPLSRKYLRTHDAFHSVKYLRALYLYGWEIEALPDSLGDLKHLRYLSIRRMVNLIMLPETLGNLLNLQTLEILDAFDLQELPKSLSNVAKLRHLILELPRYSYSLRMMPCGIGGLTQLQTLSAFVMGEGSRAAGIEELTELNDLRGKLVIKVRSLSNWFKGGKQEFLKNKLRLESLVLEFDDDDDRSTEGKESSSASLQQAEEFMEILQPHINIKGLVVDGYMGTRLPTWMASHSYRRLESIRLHSCNNFRHMPALGQLPSLKHLEVSFSDELGSVDREFMGDGIAGNGDAFLFPALEQLRFSSLHKCEGLLVGAEEGGAFPRLGLLKIEDCYSLGRIKLRHLTSLRELHVARCHNLTALDFAGRMHIPGVHTMRLLSCRRLNFPRARQWLPSSLRRFEVTGSALLEEWARRHLNN